MRRLAAVMAALALVALAVRAAVPLALELWLEARLSEVLDARVVFEDLDLNWPGRSIILEGGRVLAPDVAAAGRRVLTCDRIRLRVALRPLTQRRVQLREVRLEGLELRLVRPPEGPLNLAALLDGSGSEPLEESAVGASSESDAPSAAEETDGWDWRIARLSLEDAAIEVVGEETERFALAAGGENVAVGREFPVRLELTQGEARVDAEGSLRLAPLVFDGRVQWAGLDVAHLLALAAPGRVPWVESGIAEGDLQVRFEALSGAGSSPHLEGSGNVDLQNLRLAQQAPHPSRVKSERVKFEIDSLALVEQGGALRLRIEASEVSLRAPQVRLTVGEASPLVSEGSAPPTAPPLALHATRVAWSGGSLLLEDRRIEPPVEFQLGNLEGSARDVRWPGTSISSFEMEATGMGDEPLRAKGWLSGAEFEIALHGSRIPLSRFDAYTRRYSDYRIEGGSATPQVDLASRPDRLQGNLQLTLHDAQLRGAKGERLVTTRLGIPLHVAMALLRDVRGDIVLEVPIERESSITQVDLVGLVGSAIHQAMLNSLVAPLKLLGTVRLAGHLLPGGGEAARIEEFAPESIAFRAGRAEFTERGREQLKRLARVMDRHPALTVRLDAQVVSSDRQWLLDGGASDETIDATLRRLAKARRDRVVGFLTRDGEIENSRIDSSEPSGEDLGAGGPRLEIELGAMPPLEDVGKRWTPAQPGGGVGPGPRVAMIQIAWTRPGT